MMDSTPTQDVTPAAIFDTPLMAALRDSARAEMEYRGARIAAIFSSEAQELRALQNDVGVYDLGWRSFVRCSGRDRVRWLNGIVTNSIKSLEENAGVYAFVLNAQGRIQGDLDVYRTGSDPEALWLEIDRRQMEFLLTHFRRYIIMDQVTLEPAEDRTAIGIAGPQAAVLLDRLGLTDTELHSGQVRETEWQGQRIILIGAYSPGVPRYEVWMNTEAAAELWRALTAAGAIPCGAEAFEHLRIVEGIPAYGVDIGDRDLPQETNQMRALNFTKGCYLGQEIVERIRSRGNVHRILSGFVLHTPVASHTPLMADGKAVGELTSVAEFSATSTSGRVLALGYVRREALESHAALTANGISVVPSSLPFQQAGEITVP